MSGPERRNIRVVAVPVVLLRVNLASSYQAGIVCTLYISKNHIVHLGVGGDHKRSPTSHKCGVRTKWGGE